MRKWHAHGVHMAKHMNMVGSPGPPLSPALIPAFNNAPVFIRTMDLRLFNKTYRWFASSRRKHVVAWYRYLNILRWVDATRRARSCYQLAALVLTARLNAQVEFVMTSIRTTLFFRFITGFSMASDVGVMLETSWAEIAMDHLSRSVVLL